MSRYEAAKVLNRINHMPVMLAPGREQDFLLGLQELRGMSLTREAEREMISRRSGELLGMYGYAQEVMDKPFAYANGIAIIPIQGSLINRFSCSWGFVTGYNFIRAQMNAALEDDDVTTIVYDVNSYGGECAGCFELSNEMRASRAVKPSLAVIDSNCMSAAYALASAATKMVCTPSGSVGSIGVLAMHTDISKALEEAGYKVTLIYAGAHKVDGNSFEALPDTVKAEIQVSVDKRYGEFVDLVVENRSLDSQAVRETEAQDYRADDGLALGLIDAVETPTEAVASFLAELSADDPANIDDQETDTMLTAEQIKEWQESPEGKAHMATVAATASADAIKAHNARVTAITTHEAAKDRPALASHLAMNTTMSVEEATATLAVSAKETAAKPNVDADGNPLNDAMRASGGGADVGADAEQDDPNKPKVSRAEKAMKAAGIGSHASTSLIPRRAALARK